jgi:glycerol-3-phosphate dehydrogenase (NAD(P)+)
MLIGKGVPVEEAIKQVGMVVEGINALPAAMALAKKYQVEMPIVEAAFQVVKEGLAPGKVVHLLMSRDKKPELPPAALDNRYE